MSSNLDLYRKRDIDFHTYLKYEIDSVKSHNINDVRYITILDNVRSFGRPRSNDAFEDIKEMLRNNEGPLFILTTLLNKGYGTKYYNGDDYDEQDDIEDDDYQSGGSRRNKATPKSKAKPKAKPKHEDMTMKDIKELCKANQIKLSKVVEGKRVVYKKKELITKLKRKKLL
jgi:hypothetical protein